MQKISLQQLKKLAQAQLREDEDEFSWDKWLDAYKDAEDEVAKQPGDTVALAYEKLRSTWLKSHCPPIEFAGEGSSRAAFALDGGRCLKVATNKIGIGQNKAEAENTMLDGEEAKFAIFAKTYACSDGNTSLLTECCAQIDGSQWAQMWGLSESFAEAPELTLMPLAANWYNDGKFDWDHAADEAKASGNEDMVKLAKGIQEEKTPAMKTLASLFTFYKDAPGNWEKLLIFDLASPNNWGAAIRFGEVVPVVLDAGFSTDAFEGFSLD